MEAALEPLALSPLVKEVLLGAESSLRCPLKWLEAHEHADFARCDQLAMEHGFAPQLLEQNFQSALQWADGLLHDPKQKSSL